MEKYEENEEKIEEDYESIHSEGKVEEEIKEAKEKVLNFFSSLADETRLKILVAIANKPKNVNEIYEFIGKDKMTLSAISHQLKQLKDLNVVVCKKQGKERLYELSGNFCWCILRDTFSQFNNNLEIKCKKCGK